MKYILFSMLLIVGISASSQQLNSEIYLKSGIIVRGIIVEQTDEYILVKDNSGNETKYLWSEVDKVKSAGKIKVPKNSSNEQKEPKESQLGLRSTIGISQALDGLDNPSKISYSLGGYMMIGLGGNIFWRGTLSLYNQGYVYKEQAAKLKYSEFKLSSSQTINFHLDNTFTLFGGGVPSIGITGKSVIESPPDPPETFDISTDFELKLLIGAGYIISDEISIELIYMRSLDYHDYQNFMIGANYRLK